MWIMTAATSSSASVSGLKPPVSTSTTTGRKPRKRSDKRGDLGTSAEDIEAGYMATHRRWWLFAVLLVLVGCGGAPVRPDLKRLYATTDASSTKQPPVIVVHGVLGAKLRDTATGKEIWPGGLSKLAFSEF